MRIGHGYDVHRLVPDRKLILGGVEIPFEKGLLGHSDADVLTHAFMDALLGAAGLGDIGQHFPDTDPAYAGADSFVTSGAFATCGVNYTDLGSYTADMAVDALLSGEVPADYHVMDGGIITVNTETAAALDLSYNAFTNMVDNVVEVTTAAE